MMSVENELFISILRTTRLSEKFHIEELVNDRLDANRDTFRYFGLELKILSPLNHGYIHLSVYAYNTSTTMPLDVSVENNGKKVIIKLDTPRLIDTDRGFAGVLCDYIMLISDKEISADRAYNSIGINVSEFLAIDIDEYRKIVSNLVHKDRINDFLGLLNYIESDNMLSRLTNTMIQNTVLYEENFLSLKVPVKEGIICFEENLTLMAAKRFALHAKKTAVLNFANPVEPGGGVLRGANAQEENICRSSNLYKALTSLKAEGYYKTHRNLMQSNNQKNTCFIGTDRVIYSPNVVILKDNVYYSPGCTSTGEEEYNNVPYFVDVLTCSAPIFSDSEHCLSNHELEEIFDTRIRNIFETAIENDVEVMILGAFGCGAFHNPPNVVANAFRKVLLDKRYAAAFEQVVFAVKRRDEIICDNIETFEKLFSMFPQINNDGNESQHRRLWKWLCLCGNENSWDYMFCTKCGSGRNKRKSTILYNKARYYRRDGGEIR